MGETSNDNTAFVCAYAVGEFVRLITGDEPQKAQVTAITIRGGGRVGYEVVWWSGRNRTCAWVEACEVEALESAPKVIRIGFHSGT